MAVIELRKLSRYFRPGTPDEVRAVDDVSLTIDEGEFVVLTGPSGSGKTTLLSLFGVLDRPTAGEIIVLGQSLARCSDHIAARTRRKIGFVFQDLSLIPRLPLWENVTYQLIPLGVSRNERRELGIRLLTQLGLTEEVERRPEELSGGQRQRVAIARALVHDPSIIMADEPTSNLDAATGQQVVRLFRDLHAAGKTLVIASHDPEVVACATRVITMRAGRAESGV